MASPVQANTLFSDFLFDFDRHPATGDLLRVTNERSVLNSLRKIIKTNNYEIPYRPDFGANIYHYLFENFNPMTLNELENSIRLAIEKYEPRARILDINTVGRPDENEIDITLTVSIRTSPNPVVLSTTLTRVR